MLIGAAKIGASKLLADGRAAIIDRFGKRDPISDHRDQLPHRPERVTINTHFDDHSKSSRAP
jgi:hypothetical protein